MLYRNITLAIDRGIEVYHLWPEHLNQKSPTLELSKITRKVFCSPATPITVGHRLGKNKLHELHGVQLKKKIRQIGKYFRLVCIFECVNQNNLKNPLLRL